MKTNRVTLPAPHRVAPCCRARVAVILLAALVTTMAPQSSHAAPEPLPSNPGQAFVALSAKADDPADPTEVDAAAFARADGDRDGVLKGIEAKLVAIWDGDGDGIITKEEFNAGRAKQRRRLQAQGTPAATAAEPADAAVAPYAAATPSTTKAVSAIPTRTPKPATDTMTPTAADPALETDTVAKATEASDSSEARDTKPAPARRAAKAKSSDSDHAEGPPLNGLKPGDRVEVYWKGTWSWAKVVEAKSRKVKVSYDGLSEVWDEWVGPDRLRGAGAVPKAKAAKDDE